MTMSDAKVYRSLCPQPLLRIINIERSHNSGLFDLLRSSDNRDGQLFSIQLIIFQEFSLYLRLPEDLRAAIDQYCIAHEVGVIAFLNEGKALSTEPDSLFRVGHLPLFVHRLRNPPWGLYTAKNTTAFHLTREGRLQPGLLDNSGTGCCRATLVPYPESEHLFVPQSETPDSVYQSLVLEDLGLHDGVRRVIFSTSSDGLWINKMLLFDVIIHLSNGRIHALPPVSIALDKTNVNMFESSPGQGTYPSMSPVHYQTVRVFFNTF
ncbi:unnamed protein product [Echinostoma caproni]|uniref:HSNSD domain-containing protein n=1 Tax=Echinostoma caproni TaxID=27848 RepID=A0A183AZD1_9TREM|nr:unnamed protein product [Echinostoma caproni]